MVENSDHSTQAANTKSIVIYTILSKIPLVQKQSLTDKVDSYLR